MEQIRLDIQANTSDLSVIIQQISRIIELNEEMANTSRDGFNFVERSIKNEVSARRTLSAQIQQAREDARLAREEEKKASLQAIKNSLALNSAYNGEIGILEKLRESQKDLKVAREKANDPTDIKKLNAELEKTTNEINKLTGASNYFRGSFGFWKDTRNVLAGMFAVGEISQWIGKVLDAQKQLDIFDVSMKTFVKDNTERIKLQNDLIAFSQKTPYDLQQIQDISGRLLAQGFKSSEMIKTLQEIGNVAAATGGEFNLIAKAIVDVRNKGVLMGQEFNQFSNNSVPILQMVADVISKKYNISIDEALKKTRQMKEDHQITYSLIQEAFENASKAGGKFNGVLEEQSKKVGGLISNLFEKFQLALARTGRYFEDEERGIISWGSTLLNVLVGSETAIGRTIGAVKGIIATWIAYEVITRASAFSTTALTIANRVYSTEISLSAIIEKARLIIIGERIIANQALTGSMNVLTLAETEATIAARAFNASLGGIAIALGLAVTAYQYYSSAVDEAQFNTIAGTKANDEDIKGLQKKKVALELATTNILSLKQGSDAYKFSLQKMIATYPEYFGKLNAEKASYDEIRKARALANTEIEKAINLMAREKLAQRFTDKVVDSQVRLLELQQTGLKGVNVFDKKEVNKVANSGVYLSLFGKGADIAEARKLLKENIQYTELLKTQTNENAIYKEKQYNNDLKELQKAKYKNTKEHEQAVNELKVKYGLLNETQAPQKFDSEATESGKKRDTKDKELPKLLELLRVSESEKALIKANALAEGVKKQKELLKASLELEEKYIELVYQQKLIDIAKTSATLEQKKDMALNLKKEEYRDLLRAENDYQVALQKITLQEDLDKQVGKNTKGFSAQVSKIYQDYKNDAENADKNTEKRLGVLIKQMNKQIDNQFLLIIGKEKAIKDSREKLLLSSLAFTADLFKGFSGQISSHYDSVSKLNKDSLDRQLADTRLSFSEREKIVENYAKAETKLAYQQQASQATIGAFGALASSAEQYEKKRKEISELYLNGDKKNALQLANNISAGVSVASNIYGSFLQTRLSQIEIERNAEYTRWQEIEKIKNDAYNNDKKALEDKYQKEISLADGNAEQQKAIEANKNVALDQLGKNYETARIDRETAYLGKQKEFAKKQFETQKRLTILQMEASILQASLQIFSTLTASTLGIGAPIAAGIAGAFALAAQPFVLKVSKQEFPEFRHGIDNTDSLFHKSNERSGDGVVSVLHKGESVFNEKEMSYATKLNGGVRPLRADILEGYKTSKTPPIRFEQTSLGSLKEQIQFEVSLTSNNLEKSITRQTEKLIDTIEGKATIQFVQDRSGNQRLELRKNLRTAKMQNSIHIRI